MAIQHEIPEESFKIEGVYEGVIAGFCRRRCQPFCHRDPRFRLQELSDEKQAIWDWLQAECSWESGLDRAERLAAGEPFEVPRYMVGGNRYPLERDHPLRSRSVKKLHVFSDDSVQPVYGVNT